MRTADCVVGGLRYEQNSRLVGSLLLGLYNKDGKLDHVGFTSSIAKLVRWRPDKAPEQCTFDQMEREARPAKLVAETLDRP
jgi:ATP-dependent DNA ligase